MRSRGVAALCVIMAISLFAADGPHRPSMQCGRAEIGHRVARGRLVPIVFGQCVARDVGDDVPEWRLYGESDDELTDYDTGLRFHFQTEAQWRLLEMRVPGVRLRTWVRSSGDQVEFRQVGKEK